MPHPPDKKTASRKKILISAYELFATRGYETVTLDDVMINCGMTRGGFYAHFTNKAELYREAIKYAFANSKLATSHTSKVSEQEKLMDILNGYLSMEHLQGKKACPLAFLATDIAVRDRKTRKVFAEAYINVNQRVWDYAKTFTDLDEEDILSLTALIVGTVALARSMDNHCLSERMLNAARRHAETILGLTSIDQVNM